MSMRSLAHDRLPLGPRCLLLEVASHPIGVLMQVANQLLPGLEEAALAGGAVVTNSMKDVKEVRVCCRTAFSSQGQ